MDGNKFCKLHTDYMIDTMAEYEDYSKSIYAKGLGEIDLTEEGDFDNRCMNCGTVINERKAYCSNTCSTEDKKKHAPLAKCVMCGKDFRKFPTQKITCNERCSQLHAREQRKKGYMKGEQK